MDLKYKIVIGVAVVAVSFASGRLTAPVKIKTVTQIVQSDDKTSKENEDKNIHRNIVTKEHVNPDGSKDITTTVVEDDKLKDDKDSTDVSKTVENQTTTVTKSGGLGLTISALAGANPFLSGPSIVPVYGASISKGLIGPISIGAFGLNSGLIGGSLGVTF